MTGIGLSKFCDMTVKKEHVYGKDKNGAAEFWVTTVIYTLTSLRENYPLLNYLYT